jgi:hypothetical protein
MKTKAKPTANHEPFVLECPACKHSFNPTNHLLRPYAQCPWCHKAKLQKAIPKAAPTAPSAMTEQEGGTHYKDLTIQPVEFCQRNKLGYCESCAVKYVTRHKQKNGAEDIRKAIHFLQLLLEIEYPGQ